MQLIYRGDRYNYAPTVAESDQDSLKFSDNAANGLAPAPRLGLIYRGVHYGYAPAETEAGLRAVVKTPATHPVELIYRGASYVGCFA